MRPRVIAVTLLPLLLMFATTPAIAGQPPTNAASDELVIAPEPLNLAVLDFRVVGQGVDPAVGEALASVIRTGLVRAGTYRVIEREEIAAVVREQDFQSTDMVDPATAVQIGKIAGVDLLVLGSITKVERTFTVSCRLVDVATGEAAEAEEFELSGLESYTRLGRMLAALIGEQPLTENSIALPARINETFEGRDCRLKLGTLKDGRNRTSLERGAFVIDKAGKGHHYYYIPEAEAPCYAQVDLAQLDGPAGASCGLVWGARGSDDYLSVSVNGNGDAWVTRRQGGTTNSVLAARPNWEVVNRPPRANRLRIESWSDRHRVFVNGICIDDFHEPGYREGRVGLLASLRQDGPTARFSADNLVAGVLKPSLADIGHRAAQRPKARPETGVRPKMKRRARTAGAWAEIEKVWVVPEVYKGRRGVTVHTKFNVGRLQGHRCAAVISFADARSGLVLSGQGGQVAIGRDFSPRYRVSNYSDFATFVPLKDLHLKRNQTTLQCRVTLWDRTKSDPVSLDQSKWVKFTLPK